MKKRTMENRIVLSIVTVVFVVLGGALLVINYVLSENHQKRVEEEIVSGRESVLIARTERKLRAELVVNFLAAEASQMKEGSSGISDVSIQQLLTDSGLSFLGIVNSDGIIEKQYERLTSNNEITIRENEPVFLNPLFMDVSEGKVVSDIELCFPDTICVTAFTPVIRKGIKSPVGYIRAGFVIDDNFAREVSGVSRTDYLLLRKGRLIADSIPPGTLSNEDIENLGDSIEYFQKTSGGMNSIQNVNLNNHEYAFEASEVMTKNGEVLAVCIIARDTQGLRQSRLESIKLLGVLAVVGLLLALMLGRFFARGIFGPLNNLLENVMSITAGNTYPRLNVKRTDEIGELAGAFDEMSTAISAREEGLLKAADEIKSNQDQIIRSGRLAAIGELAAGVAHEIGNPLSAVSGYAQLISRNSSDSAKVSEYAHQIEKETEYIEKIIQDLLDFSRPSNEIKEMHDIKEIIESAVRTASSHKAFGNISVTVDISDETKLVYCNRKEITQVLLNLLINAAQEAPPETTIIVSAKEEGGNVIISVADMGKGVSDSVADKIFNPFFTTKSAADGTGLGLSVCFRILEKHGGRIWFDNLEKGVRFSLSFPISGIIDNDKII